MKLCLVAHCNFRGNSAMHVFSLATELTGLGHECMVLVPDSPETVHEHGEPVFGVLDYDTAAKKGVVFSDSRGPDLVHAWTPREHVRRMASKVARQYSSSYVVHMEDNEEQIIRDELRGLDDSDLLALPHEVIDGLIGPHRSHPHRSRRFIETAAGYSCLIDNLLEFKPKDIPGVVFWPGFDAPFENVSDKDRDVRPRYGLDERDIVLLYSGNVHASIAADIQKLYASVGLLRNYGLPVKLVRTGWTYAALDLIGGADLSDWVVDLGFVPRADLPGLVAMSDILVQPGRSDPFNDYRFPSKLPEYLVSGRPVILPDSNIGKVLNDGEHVLKLHDGSINELLHAIRTLIGSPALGRELGRNARAFAQKYLTWPRAAATLDELYRRIASTPPIAIGGGESWGESDKSVRSRDTTIVPESVTSKEQPFVRFPIKLIAFWHPYSRQDDDSDRQRTIVPRVLHQEVALAKTHGIYGFCFHDSAANGKGAGKTSWRDWVSAEGPDFPFCLCWNVRSSDRGLADPKTRAADAWCVEDFTMRILPILDNTNYIRVDGAPLLLVCDSTSLQDLVGATQAWRQLARDRGIDRLHLCAVESAGTRYQRPFGFDASVEAPSVAISKGLSAAEPAIGVDEKGMAWSRDYIAIALSSMNQPPIDHVRYKCALPPGHGAGDNLVDPYLINDSPKAYGQWLRYLVREAMVRRQQQEPLVFVDGWNEGAIRTCLQPNQRYDRSLLKVTYDALSEGIIDYGRGPTAEREREFTARIARLPLV